MAHQKRAANSFWPKTAMLAAVSHLPHMIAYALVNALFTIQDAQTPGVELQSFSGGGYKDTTRIAASSPEMWRDICLWNRENLVSQIETYQASLEKLKALIKAGDGDGLIRELDQAKQRRDRIM